MSSVSYPLIGGQNFLPDMVLSLESLVEKLRQGASLSPAYAVVTKFGKFAGSIPAHRLFMPETTISGDSIFESEENLEEEQETGGRQPLFSSPNDLIAGWMEQDRDGNWYVSLQIHLPGLKTNVPLFVNDERDDARQYINKVGQALSD